MQSTVENHCVECGNQASKLLSSVIQIAILATTTMIKHSICMYIVVTVDDEYKLVKVYSYFTHSSTIRNAFCEYEECSIADPNYF